MTETVSPDDPNRPTATVLIAIVFVLLVLLEAAHITTGWFLRRSEVRAPRQTHASPQPGQTP